MTRQRRRFLVPAILWLALVAWRRPARTDDAGQAAKLLELLELERGMTVADVGAGTGELSVLMAERLGPSGRVYSTDINRDRLADLRSAAAAHHLTNIVVVEGAARATNLPGACCDAIFLRDVYHHFVDPAAMNRSLFDALKPGGRLAVIDFVPRKGSELPPGVPANRNGHGIEPALVEQEVAAAGFTKNRRIDRWDDQDGVFLELFRKPESGR
jgi:ubiquinone/menaquinone biosynthesis C-methylase UbiE